LAALLVAALAPEAARSTLASRLAPLMEKNRWQVFGAVDGFLGERPAA